MKKHHRQKKTLISLNSIPSYTIFWKNVKKKKGNDYHHFDLIFLVLRLANPSARTKAPFSRMLRNAMGLTNNDAFSSPVSPPTRRGKDDRDLHTISFVGFLCWYDFLQLILFIKQNSGFSFCLFRSSVLCTTLCVCLHTFIFCCSREFNRRLHSINRWVVPRWCVSVSLWMQQRSEKKI